MTNEELVARIRAGERDRILELWAQVERLVRKCAQRWDRAFEGRNGATIEDYAQAGFIGFLRAIDYYQAERGAKFSTILCECIKTPFADTAGARTVRQSKEPLREPISLDAPATTDEDSEPLGNFIEDPQGESAFLEVEDQQLHDALEAALATLSPEELKVIRLRYWHDFTLDQIAAELGGSQGYAKKVHDSALRKLRHPSRSRELRAYID